MIQKNYLSVKWTIELLISFQCLLLYSVHAADSTTTCASGFSYNNGYCYRKFESKVSWSTARTACQSYGADLVSVHSAAENTYVNALCGTTVGCHSGLTDATTETTWVWSDGSAKDYTNWNAQEPNGATNQNCMTIYYYSDSTWDDGSCNDSRYYICKHTACPAGFYAVTTSTSCSQCSAGSYSSAVGSTTCVQCPVGTYADGVGAASCTSCPAGTYSNTVGATGCTQCPSGTYSNAPGSTICTSCPVGTYSNVVGLSTCNKCSVGTYSSSIGSLRCTNCAAGTYSNVEGLSACSLCAAGKYSNFGATTACSSCPAGSFSNSGATTCTLCPFGTFSNVLGAATCTSCSDGLFSNHGSTVCSTCVKS